MSSQAPVPAAAEKRELIAAIQAAFCDRTNPGPAPVNLEGSEGYPDYPAMLELDAALKRSGSQEVTMDDIDWAIDLWMFLSKDAFLLTFPLMLVAVLEHNEEMIRGLEWVLYILDGLHEEYPDTVATMSPAERAVTGRFLDFVSRAEEFARDREINSDTLAVALRKWRP